MALQFEVTVRPKRVEVKEVKTEFVKFDASAIVDGDIWRYKIKKHHTIVKADTHWRQRAYQNIHYHAHNSGVHVKFVEVNYERKTKRKINKNQLSLWD